VFEHLFEHIRGGARSVPEPSERDAHGSVPVLARVGARDRRRRARRAAPAPAGRRTAQVPPAHERAVRGLEAPERRHRARERRALIFRVRRGCAGRRGPDGVGPRRRSSLLVRGRIRTHSFKKPPVSGSRGVRTPERNALHRHQGWDERRHLALRRRRRAKDPAQAAQAHKHTRLRWKRRAVRVGHSAFSGVRVVRRHLHGLVPDALVPFSAIRVPGAQRGGAGGVRPAPHLFPKRRARPAS